MKTGTRAMDQGWPAVENWDLDRETENLDSGIGGKNGGPSGLRGSGGGISDFDGEPNFVMEPWLGRWGWNLEGESRKTTAGTGTRLARLVLVLKFIHMRI